MRGVARSGGGLAALALAVAAVAAALGSEEPPPADVGLRERVAVELVLVDVVVLDRKDRTVPGLSAHDFELRVDGDLVPIETLDARCPGGAIEDPRGGEGRAAQTHVPGAGRVVLAFDWRHMGFASRTRLSNHDAIRSAARALESGAVVADEIMVVSIGDGLRVELPFTSDRQAVLRAIRRLEADPSIFVSGPRLTEFPYFGSLLALLDVMERVPGRKAVVLFSGRIEDDGWSHDNEYARLAAMAATSRTAIYPVDSGGLRTLLDADRSGLGGPAFLHRVADETGGRMTADTNDLTLGPARASRDLGCTYTLGFRDHEPRPDTPRRLTLLLPEKDGLHVRYPFSYVVRSTAARARSLLETASMDPSSFESDGLRVEVAVADVASARRRNATIAVTIASAEAASAPGERALRGFVRSESGHEVHRFERCVVPGETQVAETATLRPGRYVASAVLEDPEGGSPLAASVAFTVSGIPDAPARQR